MLYLPPHGQDDQNDPVNDQDGPEHGQIKDLAPTARKRQTHCPGGRMPELEFRQTAHKGLEFLVVLGR